MAETAGAAGYSVVVGIMCGSAPPMRLLSKLSIEHRSDAEAQEVTEITFWSNVLSLPARTQR